MAVCALSLSAQQPATVGQPLPLWSDGCLDIHAISTGRGEITFMIFPDSTTLVVDCGEFSRQTPEYANTEQRPDPLTRPTSAMGAYIRHFMPTDSIDYFMLSHFHMDHMGNIEPEYVADPAGGYVLAGLTALYHQVPFRHLIDRAYPAYDSLACMAMSRDALTNYRRFVDYHTARGTLKADSMHLGSTSQIALCHAPERYPSVKVANLCSDGRVWHGSTAQRIVPRHQLRENAASCGILATYGDFDYLSAGDLSGPIEIALAQAIGRPIEACKANHHLSPKSMQPQAMEILRPDCVVTQSFYQRRIQPDRQIIASLLDAGIDHLYFTNIPASMLSEDPAAYSRCANTQGHVVIRVAPGGSNYWVYVLSNTDNNYTVSQIDGPFNCK